MKKNYPIICAVGLFLCQLFPSNAYAQAGAIDLSFDPGAGTTEGTGLYNNGSVHALDIQSDGKIIIGGTFTDYNGIPRKNIARILPDGSLDQLFDPGTGANDRVEVVKVHNGLIMIGGSFSNYNGQGRFRFAALNDDGSINSGINTPSGSGPFINTIVPQTDNKFFLAGHMYSMPMFTAGSGHIFRFNSDGTRDLTFDTGVGFGTSSAQSIFSADFQSTGKLLVIGNISSYSGTSVNKIARLNVDGTLDQTFNPGTGPDQVIMAMAFQDDEKPILAGSFNSFNGITKNRICRLNMDGSVDNTFDAGTGPNGLLYSLAIQADGKILVGGSFSTWNGITRKGLVRLNLNGSLDTTFNSSIGTGGTINNIIIQPDGKILIAGIFSEYGGKSRVGIARVHNDGAAGMDYQGRFLSPLRVYPNPASEYFILEMEEGAGIGSYTIYNTLGEEVSKGITTHSSVRVDISGLQKGVYIVRRSGSSQLQKLTVQ